jgi:Zn-dependent oligopeptidase
VEKTFLAGLLGLGFLVSACSENEPNVSEDIDVTAAPSEVGAMQTAVTFATAGPGVLSEGFDASLSLEAFNAQCDEAVSKLKADYETLKGFDGPATIETVIRPYDTLGAGPGENGSWAYFLSSVHPDPEMRAAGDTCVQRFIEIGTNVSMDRDIYALLTQADLSGADPVLKRYVENEIKEYERSGVDKDDATRDKIRELIQNGFATGQAYNKNISEDVRYVEVSDVADLDGLPEDFIANHQPDENGVIRLSTNYPDYFPVMSYAHSDELRQRMRIAYGGRAYPVNEGVLRQLLQTRFELAQTLGYESYATSIMEDRMIESAANAERFVDKISSVVKAPAEVEKARLLKRYQQIDPEATEVKPWQRGYVMEIIKREEYQVDSKEVREYFQYDLVRDGIFELIQDLFGLQIKPWETSVWDESVESFGVYENGNLIGRFYLDMHPRDGKYKHAAHMRLREGIVGRQIPISALMCNFPGGDATAGLMEHNQVETFLHEFGHLIHNMLSGTQEWGGISGMSMEHDFVEAPSQMLEEWVWDYETVSKFAKNQDGAVLPEDLFNKMKAARTFGLATGTAGQTFLAAVSLKFYDRDPEGLDFVALQKELYAKYSVFEYEDGTYLFANFGHLNGYSANYYTYQWSNAIAADLFTQFEKAGLRDKDTAMRYRNLVLGAAGSKPAAEFLEDFLGRPWSLDAYKTQLESAAEEGGKE